MKVVSINKKITIMSVALLLAASILIYTVMQLLALPIIQQQVQQEAKAQVSAAVNELKIALQDADSLTQSLASLAQTLPLDRAQFELLFPPLIDKFDDRSIVGGGIWPEPNAFAKDTQRHSFYWARSGSGGKLQLINDYNDSSGSGYHNEGWYKVGSQLKAGQCAWSEAYEDPVYPVPMVTCTVAITRNNTFWGVATIDLALDGLKELFEKQNTLTGGYSFAIDQSEQIVSFPQIRSQSLAMTPLNQVVANDRTLQPLAIAIRAKAPVSRIPAGVTGND
ncbi:MAG: methyl-accepting chemotaxis protein, partial [Oceanospirillaceae bacterium]